MNKLLIILVVAVITIYSCNKSSSRHQSNGSKMDTGAQIKSNDNGTSTYRSTPGRKSRGMEQPTNGTGYGASGSASGSGFGTSGVGTGFTENNTVPETDSVWNNTPDRTGTGMEDTAQIQIPSNSGSFVNPPVDSDSDSISYDSIQVH